MSDLPIVIENGAAHVTLDLRVYRLTAIKKAAYTIAAQCTVALGAQDGHCQHLTFLAKAGATERSLLEASRVFFQELLDQDLREQISEETSAVRTLVLAHAFSKTDLIRRT